VLVVDDNADLATSTAALLEMWGHRAEIAHNGNDALAAALAFAPQIILLDIGLPELDGFEVALAIRARPELAGVRLIAVSGYGGADDALAAQHAGFDRYLVKPLQPDVLRELIEREGAAG
jgi:CheY-like chemotaxis protein